MVRRRNRDWLGFVPHFPDRRETLLSLFNHQFRGFSQTATQSPFCARVVTLLSQATAATLGKYLR
jgi:hypothetical protein